MKLVLGTAALAAALMMTACGGPKQETGPEQVVTQVTTEGDAVSVSAGESERLAAGTALMAEDLPPFAPLYPGATVVGVGDATGQFMGGRMITMTTTDSLDAVMAFYDERITTAGATPGARTQTATSASRSVSMDGAPRGSIVADAADGTTTITITHATPGSRAEAG